MKPKLTLIRGGRYGVPVARKPEPRKMTEEQRRKEAHARNAAYWAETVAYIDSQNGGSK